MGIEDIINLHQVKGNSQFLVKWKDYGKESNSWEPEENLQHCPEILGKFLARGDLPLDGGSVRNPIYLITAKNHDESPNLYSHGYQVGDLESCERCHNGVDRHHPSEDFGMYVISSKITGKIRKYVVYIGVYSYILGGVGQHQRGPGVMLRGVELCWLFVDVLVR
ncbi:Chromobox protein 1 [Entomophthora muscae]|uniref:Chromobox protein 1 n=1 Tax=Entomophthora muscae TaxID=34485 RepID=A0ACC2U4F1_9FUNG|nr:Chromobox protein 1 [Entomophthora muscae]